MEIITLQYTSPAKIHLKVCLPHTKDQGIEDLPKPAAVKFVAEEEQAPSPYYHREIF